MFFSVFCLILFKGEPYSKASPKYAVKWFTKREKSYCGRGSWEIGFYVKSPYLPVSPSQSAAFSIYEVFSVCLGQERCTAG